MLFGSDFPLIPPDKWIKAFDEAGFKPELREPILKGNAAGLLFGTPVTKEAKGEGKES